MTDSKDLPDELISILGDKLEGSWPDDLELEDHELKQLSQLELTTQKGRSHKLIDQITLVQEALVQATRCANRYQRYEYDRLRIDTIEELREANEMIEEILEEYQESDL